MRVAVVSDIHANLHALDAVLAELDRDPPDQIWSLGDVVGYGPRPNECCRFVRDRAAVGLVGNHDLVVLGDVDVAEFNPDAGRAAAWTREEIDDASEAYLRGLAPAGTADGVELYHASPRDPVWEYVLDDRAVEAAFALTRSPFVLIGHSHVPIVARLDDRGVDAAHAPGGTEIEAASERLLLNPGSVGQPRDGDPRAAYLLLDLGAGRASFRRVAYPVERTQAEIRERRLPDALAERLAYGV
jgi:diadenosine tetraphosphatase ApaH/serine/threonine PP2A family protein phosphatase